LQTALQATPRRVPSVLDGQRQRIQWLGKGLRIAVDSLRLHLSLPAISDMLACLQLELDALATRDPSPTDDTLASGIATRAQAAVGRWNLANLDKKATLAWCGARDRTQHIYTTAVAHSMRHQLATHGQALTALEVRWASLQAVAAQQDSGAGFSAAMGIDMPSLRRRHSRRRRQYSCVDLSRSGRHLPISSCGTAATFLDAAPASLKGSLNEEATTDPVDEEEDIRDQLHNLQAVIEASTSKLPSTVLRGPLLAVKQGQRISAAITAVPDYELLFLVKVGGTINLCSSCASTFT